MNQTKAYGDRAAEFGRDYAPTAEDRKKNRRGKFNAFGALKKLTAALKTPETLVDGMRGEKEVRYYDLSVSSIINWKKRMTSHLVPIF